MFKLIPNLGENEKISRIVIGVILILAGLIGLGRLFLILVGIILLVEGLIGWCGIPIFIDKYIKPKSKPPGSM